MHQSSSLVVESGIDRSGKGAGTGVQLKGDFLETSRCSSSLHFYHIFTFCFILFFRTPCLATSLIYDLLFFFSTHPPPFSIFPVAETKIEFELPYCASQNNIAGDMTELNLLR